MSQRFKAARLDVIAVRVVDDVSITLYRGETFGIVVESDCGKSTLARALLRLVEPASGASLSDGEEILQARRPSRRP